MPSSKFFWNILARRYSKQPIADETAYAHKLEVTRQYLTPEKLVLEFGCGTGSTALLHAPFVKHLHAIDYSESMIRIANEKLKDSQISNLTFAVQSIEDLSDQAGTYDVVLGLNILHLLDDRASTFKKVYDLLKPGGHFIASTACLGRSGRLMRTLLPIGGKLGLIPRVSLFTREILQEEMRSAGFNILYKWEQKPSPVLFTVVERPA